MGKHIKTPTFLQNDITECGAVCMAIILGYFGKNYTLQKMYIDTNSSKLGCTAKGLKNAAQKNGLECHAYSINANELNDFQPPCILYWNNNHFVVFEGTGFNKIYINDPAFGRRKISYSELNKSFSGVILTFRVNDDFLTIEELSKINNYEKVPLVITKGFNECGAACISMILSYYGIDYDYKQVYIDSNTSDIGCSAGDLLRASKKYGLECRGYTKSIKDLLELKMPCILFFEYNLFVILEGINNGDFLL